MTIGTAQQRIESEDSDNLMTTLALKTGAFVLGLLMLLSVLSYNTRDTQFLEGGLDSDYVITNWVGRIGAWFADIAFMWIGLAVYPAIFLIVICIAARTYGKRLRPLRGSYIAAITIAILGFSMLLGSFPEQLARFGEPLNIGSFPAGVIGNRFCSPDGGWMSIIANTPGSIIISSTMIVLGLLTIWFFDWHQRSRVWIGHFRSRSEAQKLLQTANTAVIDYYEPEPMPEPEPEPAYVAPKKAKPKKSRQPKAAVAVRPMTQKGEAPTLESGENKYADYRLPSLKLLNELPNRTALFDPKEINAKKVALQQTMESFGVDATVGDATSGPRVTLFEIKPAPGVKVERIKNLQSNIAMNLKAESLRILAPIPGKDCVGIEIPNNKSSAVHYRELLQSTKWRDFKGALPICLGKDISGQPEILDLARAPHLLIAGQTGSGKSVCMNSLIMSLLFRFKPDELKLIMVDPKQVEFAGYEKLPHLVAPVVNDVKKVPLVLNWAVKEMERRLRMLSLVGVRNIGSFNARKLEAEPVMDDDGKPIPPKLPYVVVVIDELADIMATSKQEVETLLARIAAMARAVGIHAVIATQRPSVNVITGVIKANFPTRIAFQVTSLVDSRTIIDVKGAESLLGRGDMLFKPPGTSKLERVQGCFLDDSEIDRTVDFITSQAEPEYVEDIFKTATSSGGGASSSSGSGSAGGATGDNGFTDAEEELVQRAIEVIMKDRRATTSHVQRRLRIGYNRASLIIEELERRGVVGPQIGSAPRDILLTDDAGSSEADDTADGDDDHTTENTEE